MWPPRTEAAHIGFAGRRPDLLFYKKHFIAYFRSVIFFNMKRTGGNGLYTRVKNKRPTEDYKQRRCAFAFWSKLLAATVRTFNFSKPIYYPKEKIVFMKKLLLILITVLNMSLPGAVSQVTLTVDDITTCDVNQVSVGVSINDLLNIGAMQFTVNWDPAILDYSSVTGNLPPFVAFNDGNAAMGSLEFAWFDNDFPFGDETPLSGDVLFTITFDLLGTYGQSSTVTIDPSTVLIGDAMGNNVMVNIVQGGVTVSDTEDPVISGCPSDISVQIPFGATNTPVNYTAPTASDNCAIQSFTGTHAPGDIFNAGVTPVTYTATDEAGNVATCTFNVEVTPDPFAPGAPRFYITNDTLDCGATHVKVGLGVVNFSNVASFNFPIGWDTMELVFDTLTIDTNINNTFSLSNVNQSDTANGELRLSYFSITPVPLPDSTIIMTIEFDLKAPPMTGAVFVIDFDGFSMFPKAVFDGNGMSIPNVAFVNGEVHFSPDDPPVINNCPANIVVNTDMGQCGALVTWTLPTVSDDCDDPDPPLMQTAGPGSGSLFPVGTTTVTYSATDSQNQTGTCSFTVTVNDNEDPTISCPANQTLHADANCEATLPDYSAQVTASDNCPGVGLSQSPPAGTTINATTTVTFTATDASGNTATCSFEVSIVDVTPPSITTCAPDDVLVADNNCEAVLPNYTGMVVFSDNCDNVGDIKITQVPANGSTINSNTTVWIFAEDLSGNKDSCSLMVTLNDNTPPAITCPANVTTNTDPGTCSAPVTWPMATATDNCGVASVVCNPASGSVFSLGMTTVTCTATDTGGNTTDCTFTVTVNDNETPAITCPSDVTVLIPMGITDTMVANIAPVSVSDNCMGVGTTYSLSGATMGNGTGDASGTTFSSGTTTVTYTAQDASGNVQSCSFEVIVQEAVIISLTCDANQAVSTDAGQCSATLNTAAPGVSPLSGVDTLFFEMTGATTGSGADSLPDTQVFNLGMTTVTYTAVSITNDTTKCSFTVMVSDQQAPAITCPTDTVKVDNATDLCGVLFDANHQMATATDNCPGVQVAYSIAAGALIPAGTTTITATATDQAGNTAACNYILMVRDTQPPDIAPCPANITVNNDSGVCGAVVTWTAPTATDNCGVLFIEPTPYEPGDLIPVGTEFITYTASDMAGNITECIFTITVRDNEPPALAPCPANITVDNDAGLCSADVSWPFIQPTDNCGVVSFVLSHQSGATFPIGTTPVQAVATDGAGNVTVCSFEVTVVDAEFPVFTNFPNDFVVYNDPGICGAVVSWANIVATDNCGVDTLFCDAVSGNMFPAGMTNVSCTVVDENGNSVMQEFSVTVIDNEPPVVNCPDDILIFVDGSVVDDPSGFLSGYVPVACDSVVANYNLLTATDNCSVAAISQPVGPVSGSTLGAGQHLLTYTIEDINGNDVVCSFNINVEPVADITADVSPNNPCEGSDVLFFAPAVAGAVYEWTDPMGNVISTDPSFTLSGVTPDMSGTYEVTVSYAFSCVQKAKVDLTVFHNPDLSVVYNDLLCTAAGTPLTLEAMDAANAGIVNYEWSTPGGAVFFGNPVTVNAPVEGTYAVTATTDNGCTATTSVFVEISIVPETPDLSGPAQACIGEPVSLDGEEFSGPGISYHWSASPDLATAGINDINNHDNEANPTAPGIYHYYFYVTQGGCISDSAEVVVVVEDFPSFTLSTDGPTTCVDGTTDVIISANTNTAGLSWSITGPCPVVQADSMFTLGMVDANCSGTYSVTAGSAIGCSSTESVVLNITEKPIAPDLQVTDDTICMGGSTTLFVTNVPSGANLLCYENGVPVACSIINSPIQPTATTVYGVQFNINGCTSDTTFNMVVVDVPADISITPEGDVTCVDGTSDVTLKVSGQAGYTYEWDGPCGVQTGNDLLIPNVTPACSGVYSVSATGPLGQCLSVHTFQLEISGMLEPVTAVQNGAACEGGDVSFCAEPMIPGANYTWRDPFGNVFSTERCPTTAALSASTPYSVEVELEGCTSFDDTLVNVLTAPVANPETVVGLVNTPQSFNVVVNDVLATDDYNITVVQQPSHGNVSYNGEGVFTYTPDNKFRETDVMAYQICYDECMDLCDIALVTILVRYPLDTCIATTVITPNDDGINDEFVVSCLELGGCPSNQLFIFNQWGDLVFEAAPYDNTWKGTYNGRDLPDGTYFYVFKCDNTSPAEKGFVMIYR